MDIYVYRYIRTAKKALLYCSCTFSLTNAGHVKYTWNPPFSLEDSTSPLQSALYLSDLYRKQHHPSLSGLILFSPHLPIGSSCFGLQHLCFQTCVLTGPHLALLSGTPLPKCIKLISTSHAASILKCHCSETSFSRSLPLIPQGFCLLTFVFHFLFPVSRFLWIMFFWNCRDLTQLREGKSCAVFNYTFKCLKRGFIVRRGLCKWSATATTSSWYKSKVHDTCSLHSFTYSTVCLLLWIRRHIQTCFYRFPSGYSWKNNHLQNLLSKKVYKVYFLLIS